MLRSDLILIPPHPPTPHPLPYFLPHLSASSSPSPNVMKCSAQFEEKLANQWKQYVAVRVRWREICSRKINREIMCLATVWPHTTCDTWKSPVIITYSQHLKLITYLACAVECRDVQKYYTELYVYETTITAEVCYLVCYGAAVCVAFIMHGHCESNTHSEKVLLPRICPFGNGS